MAKKEKIDFSDNPEWTDADFKRAHRVTPKEHDEFRKALAAKNEQPYPSRMGRPPKGEHKFIPVSFRLPPAVLTWLKEQSKRRKVGYQTLATEILVDAQTHSRHGKR